MNKGRLYGVQADHLFEPTLWNRPKITFESDGILRYMLAEWLCENLSVDAANDFELAK
jgi:hypothetical protein